MLRNLAKIQALFMALLLNAVAVAADAVSNAPMLQTKQQPASGESRMAASAQKERIMLYNANCAVCHGQAKRGQPAARIQTAIDKNTGGMGTLRFLSSEQVRSIAAFR